MKVAITSTGLNLESEISLIFGRSPYFIIMNLENDAEEFSLIENPAKNEMGAGSIAAQFLVDQGIDALILGELGNIAFGILRNNGVKIYRINHGTVETTLKQFKDGKLDEVTSVSGGFPENGRGSRMGRR